MGLSEYDRRGPFVEHGKTLIPQEGQRDQNAGYGPPPPP